MQHDLGSIDVSVQIYDEAGSVIFPDAIVIVDANNLQITFSSAQTGRCVVISGSVSGIARPQYGFVFTQATASNTWTIDHNLGYYPAVKIFVDGYEVQPSQIFNPSLNRTIVSFTSPKDGVARLI